ncbi:sulfatase-modifying factor enzyme 1 [Nonlabens xylanidelens]|uniref:Sulfatase-modifying factor enzyme 1 n=2 Tax=Nonlabens xylanidelens TaxID=191564 RepID=A0A2S6ILD9_9FLAO|nr:sulfatase-modifying factor enzyme 1 [Nonlabens xylanidelens]
MLNINLVQKWRFPLLNKYFWIIKYDYFLTSLNIMNKITKHSFVALCILIITTSCSVFQPVDTNDPLVTDPSTPPGTIQLTENLYIDRVPVTNLMYKEFLDNLSNYWSMKKHEELKTFPRFNLDADSVFIPWTGNTRLLMSATHSNPQEMITSKLSTGNYSSSPFFQWHPVVNINKEQAELFCLWRTDLANAVYAIKSKNESKRARFPYKVKYRLPTEKEMIAAQNKLEREFKLTKYQNQIFAYTGDFGLFRRMQNETEQLTITEIKEIGKDKTYNAMLDRNLSYYQQSELKTGFRCICEIIEEDE